MSDYLHRSGGWTAAIWSKMFFFSWNFGDKEDNLSRPCLGRFMFSLIDGFFQLQANCALKKRFKFDSVTLQTEGFACVAFATSALHSPPAL